MIFCGCGAMTINKITNGSVTHIGVAITWDLIVMRMIYALMLVIINVSAGSKEIVTMASIAIGGSILLEAMFAGPMTKASMNPIRSLAPAMVSGNLQHLWLYLTAPI